ncbi:response regulator [uncultured Microbacterium sp.]|uniref:response regulator n=1 Tax=uncultured Microbacterium sp. TaxID=191216 RepID=UPI0025FE8557|nr:response regulator [uncultured Microbacterium sp.]
MALARLHGGPLDGQIIPLDDTQGRLILPYSESQIVYEQRGGEKNTGPHDGPTEIDYWYEEALEDINPADV